MTDKQILETIQHYEVAKEFLETHDYVKDMVGKIELVQKILEEFESLEELKKVLDMFKEQNYLLKEYLTLEEAAAYTGVSIHTLRRCSLNRRLPVYKPWGRLMFKKDEILKMIAGNRIMSQQEIMAYSQNYCENASFKPAPRKPRQRRKKGEN